MKTFLLKILLVTITRLTGSDAIERLKHMIAIAASQDLTGEEKRTQVMLSWKELAEEITRDIGTNMIDIARAVLVAWMRSQNQIN